MLFEFHRLQNSKKPGSIHATYLVTGLQRPEQFNSVSNGHGAGGEDTYMQSSPFMSSSIAQPEEQHEAKPVQTIMLVKEEDLEGANGVMAPIIFHKLTYSCRGYSTIRKNSVNPFI
jgi:DNA polymerase delta subunit 3